jgi:co-chaperonin GroES (HSP10)
VNLRPIKDRVLIKPLIPPTVTESGIILAEERKPEQTGTVVAVGPQHHPRRSEALELSEKLFSVATVSDRSADLLSEASFLLSALVRKEPEVKVGDYVVFSYVAGQEIWVNDHEERYLLMRESDILCVVEGLEV